jgi:PPP family 3-phenylpropionic acid transporter
VLTHFGTQAFLPLFIGLSLLRGFAALGLPNFRAPKTKTQKTKPTMSFFASIGPGFVLPLVGWSLVHCTHFILNGFLGVLWHQQGLSASTIGILIGVSSIAETIMFFTFKHLALRFSPQSLILLSCLVAVARWTLFAFSPGVEILFFCQLLHAVTYAAGFLACTNFIADQVSEEIAAEAQSFFSILQSALAILALGCFGWFAGTYGAKAFLVSAALAALGAFLILPGFFSQKRSGKLKADPHVE